ncbi:hypothetical protein H0G86_003344 [Trichoderma simmonsii]|uniref:Uncharacterized protein n=1 Tax=Trichoderma simmonsii TaxID=1491479 RepID=A0A8G0LAG2_9HYPO|nr:hypothetical protein H0G86_003344 [Trichoderma simmonsii]
MFFYQTNEGEIAHLKKHGSLPAAKPHLVCVFGPTRDRTAICSIQRIENSDKILLVLRDDGSELSPHTRDATETTASGSTDPMDWVQTTNQSLDNSPK